MSTRDNAWDLSSPLLQMQQQKFKCNKMNQQKHTRFPSSPIPPQILNRICSSRTKSSICFYDQLNHRKQLKFILKT